MTRYLLVELDQRDGERIARIIENVPKVTTQGEAIHWALQKAATEWEKGKPLEITWHFTPPMYLGGSVEKPAGPIEIPIVPLHPGKHITSVIELPGHGMAQFRNPILVEVSTLRNMSLVDGTSTLTLDGARMGRLK
jgi:hypothetical protein